MCSDRMDSQPSKEKKKKRKHKIVKEGERMQATVTCTLPPIKVKSRLPTSGALGVLPPITRSVDKQTYFSSQTSGTPGKKCVRSVSLDKIFLDQFSNQKHKLDIEQGTQPNHEVKLADGCLFSTCCQDKYKEWLPERTTSNNQQKQLSTDQGSMEDTLSVDFFCLNKNNPSIFVQHDQTVPPFALRSDPFKKLVLPPIHQIPQSLVCAQGQIIETETWVKTGQNKMDSALVQNPHIPCSNAEGNSDTNEQCENGPSTTDVKVTGSIQDDFDLREWTFRKVDLKDAELIGFLSRPAVSGRRNALCWDPACQFYAQCLRFLESEQIKRWFDDYF